MNLRSPFKIGIKPKGGSQYVNEIDLDSEKKLVVNSSIEDAEDVQRIGIVVSLPLINKTSLKLGDEVVVHHNVFRITYDDKGIPRQSDFHFINDLFFISDDLIYMVIREGKVLGYKDNVFVKPIKEYVAWEGEITIPNKGELSFPNEKLINEGVSQNQKVAIRKFTDYKFHIFGETYYKMTDNRVLATLN